MNDFRQCKWCGGIYKFSGSTFCGNCVVELDMKFKKIKDFLYKNENATVADVVENTEADEKTVLYFLKEGRLEMKATDTRLICEKCGRSISIGRLCKQCSAHLSSVLDSVTLKTINKEKKMNEKEDTLNGKSQMFIQKQQGVKK